MKRLIFLLTLLLVLAGCTQQQTKTAAEYSTYEINEQIRQNTVTISAELYENGLSPRTITIKEGKTISLLVFNNMNTSLLKIEDYNIEEQLPPNAQYEINFQAVKTGNFRIIINDIEMGILSVN